MILRQRAHKPKAPQRMGKTMVVTMVVVCFQVFPAFILLSGRVLLTLPIKFKEEPCAEGRTGPFDSLSS